MPNHVINEIIFPNVDADQRAAILAKVSGKSSPIDFSVLLPVPLNYWQGSVGKLHEEVFPGNALEWCTDNWGTKWNAYGIDEGGRYQSVVEGENSLTLTFQTAWGPPMGWIVALYNTFNLAFEYRWLSEGGESPKRGTFKPFDDNDLFDKPWAESIAQDEIARHLHKLLWGVESFDESEA